jgi:antitoxin YefM
MGLDAEEPMKSISADEARATLYKLIDKAAKGHGPIKIRGKRHNAVLVSATDWEAIQETLYLQSIPGMVESIKKGSQAPLEECDTKLCW